MKVSKLKKVKMPVEMIAPDMDSEDSPAPESDAPLEGSEDAAQEADESPLAQFSDDDLVAEVIKRGLADESDIHSPSDQSSSPMDMPPPSDESAPV